LKGKRLFDERFGNKANEKRITIISGSLNNKFIAPFRFEGYTNTEVFNTWIKEVLLPELKSKQVIIMDNASFHKSERTRELIESKGCELIFLPPYSPDFNPIEKSWGSMKKLYRNYKHKYEDVYELIDLLLCNKYKTTV
jgi:transposase